MKSAGNELHIADSVIRRFFLVLMPIGMAACFLAIFLDPSQTPVDVVVLPLLGLTLGAFSVWLWLDQRALQFIKTPLFALFIFYQLAGLVSFTQLGLLYSQGLSITAIWFTVVYPFAFLLYPLGLASRISVLYLLAALLIGLWGISQSPSFTAKGVNGGIQFFLGNAFLLVLLYLYARYRYAYDRMNLIAHTDHLTGLPNRRRMTQLIEEGLTLKTAEPIALLILDLDHFKQINDSYGHSAGDQVLREASLVLQSRLRSTDVLARWGGEEFLVLAPGSTLEAAQALGQRLREALEATPLQSGVRVTVSLGLTTSRPSDTPDTLLHRADTALYRAKAAGRNRLEVELAG
ncbi:MAG: GGDEF domain-containing protein [Meiothermus sp.]|nr:GGDEF domain-containing protein [Meiothermus sp.]